MDQPEKKKAPFNGGGFTTAALLAPGIAVSVWLLGMTATELSIGPGEIGTLIGSLLFMTLIFGIWGALPSLLFGGLVLAVIRRMPWFERPMAVVFMIGGAVAAGLYVLTGLGVAELSPGAAMFFAPWAAPNFLGGDQDGNSPANWWVVASLLLSGATAGLIYSAFAKRG